VSASTKQDLESRVYERQLLAGAAGTKVKLTLADAEGHRRDASVERIARSKRPVSRPRKPLVEYRALPSGIAYVAINSFDDGKVVGEFEAVMPELKQARAIVIDLRDNGGGNSGNGDRILQMITAGDYPSQTWWTREYRPAMRAWGIPERRYSSESSLRGSAEESWKPAITLLIGPRTYSAAEDFTVAFLAAKRGRLVGEATGGSTGQPLAVALPGGGSARICSKRNTLSDGREFVGVGIQPDLLVRPTLAGVRAGRDEVLDAAVRQFVP
jgi:C-terminal processing protease CtpA/Prc